MLPVSAAVARRAEALRLTPAETTRYSRHLLLPEVGPEGQRRLKAARVLVLGAGGLGSPVCLYLAAAGVGTLGLVDFDVVETTNLQRQILYADADAGRPKLEAAAGRLARLAPGLELVPHAERFAADNAARLVASYDLVVDGTDNFPTRFLASDACVLAGKPYVYGSVFRFDGQASVFYAPHGPCYRCLFPAPPPSDLAPSCAEGGVLGVLPGQIGTIQATETLKLLLGIGEPLLGRLLTLDARSMRFDEFRIPRDPSCPACGERPTITSLAASAASCAAAAAAPVPELTVAEYVALRARGEAHLLIDIRAAGEAAVCRIDGSLHVPLAELEHRLAELPLDRPLIIYCKSGARSAKAVALLSRRGFANARSLRGGILAWIDAYAPELPRY